MRAFAESAERLAATTKKLEKMAIVADYFRARTVGDAAVSAVFLSGRTFPAWEETTLQVGGSLLWRVVAELSRKSEAELTAAYRRHGDLGAVAGEVLTPGSGGRLSVTEVAGIFRQIAAACGPAAKAGLVRDLLSRATPLETKYIVKVMTGDLRIGMKESLVEEAIAKAYGSEPGVSSSGILASVQRANMLLGDIGATLRLAAEGRLAEARMRMFHPLGFMLASPAASAQEALGYFSNAAVEDKYDGIRAQAHVSGSEVKIFSRTRDEITESFPELPDALAGLPQDAILDGEIVAWECVAKDQRNQSTVSGSAEPGPQGIKPASSQTSKGTAEAVPFPNPTEAISSEHDRENLGRARPFNILQQRLGRKKVSARMLREIPVAYLVFDVLYAGGELLIDRPLRERARILDELLKEASHGGHRGTQRKSGSQGSLAFSADEYRGRAGANVIRAPVFHATSPGDLEALFDAAQGRGNEGLMIKDLDSPYTPGKRGKAWLKMKRELATLDVVVTAVEYGHGRRVGVLSDYTFAVWDGERLVNIGKAYSGLTDAEIAEMTQWFLTHTVDDQGFRRAVEPKIVLEVAFNNIMRSDRHDSGYALRFPRIVRLRPDKSAKEADTIERVKEVFEKQT